MHYLKVSALERALQDAKQVTGRPVSMHEYLSEQAAWKTMDRLDEETEGDIDPEYNPETHYLVALGKRCFEIGDDYAAGLTVPENRELAVAWYKKAVQSYELAAKKGDAYAQEQLGDINSEGHYISRNKDQAFSWWRESAANGRVSAQYRLGQKYYFGEEVEKDFVEALFWFHVVLASHQSDVVEEKRQATNYGNDAALHLTPSVLEEVLERVRKWLEEHPKKPQGLYRRYAHSKPL
jgi:TPR repeat protein